MFGAEVDYVRFIKLYGETYAAASWYCPAACTSIVKHRIEDSPDKAQVSTGYVERQNFTMRMHMRRFTRLTNALSKKVENHIHMVALYNVFYNFVRMHKTLRCSPAMAAGLPGKLWSIEGVVALSDAGVEALKARDS